MTPHEVLGQVLSRLREDLDVIDQSRKELHPERHKDAVDALFEVEQLLRTQINRLNRVQRRYGNA